MAGEKMDRREAVQRVTTLLAGAIVAPAWTHVDLAPIIPGLQLYTVRSEMEKSVERTLARVARIGYREVEFADHFKKKPADLARILRANGLTAPSGHTDYENLGKGWSKILDGAATIGQTWVVIPSIPDHTADAYKRAAAAFNTAASAAKAHGLRFAFHNHAEEHAPLGATNGHAILMAECDPALVEFELDLYWITKAGGNALEYVTRYPGRFPLVHVKDMARDGSMTDVGTGTIDFQRIFSAAKGVKHYYAEHDDPKSAFDSITTSMAAMRRFTT